MPIYNDNYVAPVWINDMPPAIDEDEMRAMSQTIQASQVLVGSGAPTQYTSGAVGQRYADTSTTPWTIYRLETAAEDANVWKLEADANGNLALDYDPSSTYEEGQYCIYQGKLYRANQDIDPAEAWTAAHWDRAWLANEVAQHVLDRNNPHEVTAEQVPYQGTVGGIAVTNVEEAIDELEDGKAPAENGVYFGVCSTAEDTAAKEVTISGITSLYNGLKIQVLFEDNNTESNPTLNVNSLGAYPIVSRGTQASVPAHPNIWSPGEAIELIYYSANAEWRMVGFGVAGTTFYGRTLLINSVSYSANDRAATASAVKTAYDAAVNAAQKPGSITLSLPWSGSGPYTQVVTVTGTTVTANSKVDLQPTPAQIEQLISDGVEALVIENNNGTLTATAIGAAPSTALTLQCTVTEVTA